MVYLYLTIITIYLYNYITIERYILSLSLSFSLTRSAGVCTHTQPRQATACCVSCPWRPPALACHAVIFHWLRLVVELLCRKARLRWPVLGDPQDEDAVFWVAGGQAQPTGLPGCLANKREASRMLHVVARGGPPGRQRPKVVCGSVKFLRSAEVSLRAWGGAR